MSNREHHRSSFFLHEFASCLIIVPFLLLLMPAAALWRGEAIGMNNVGRSLCEESPSINYPVYPSCTGEADHTIYPSKPSGTQLIRYKITPKMWNSVSRTTVPTPNVIIEKIKKCFALWESVPTANIGFSYDGATPLDSYSSTAETNEPGCIYVVLNGDLAFGSGEAGLGGYRTNSQGQWQGGYAFYNTKAGLYSLKLSTLIHEIGHALRLTHIPVVDSAMHCGTPAWDDYEFLAFSELDRAQLSYLWPVSSSEPYTISGTLSNSTSVEATVYAVNTLNGRTFMTQTFGGVSKTFTIPVPIAGYYRVFAKENVEDWSTVNPSSPSWYVAGGNSTNDPYAGTVLGISGGNRNITNVNFVMIQQQAPFNISWGMKGSPWNFCHAWLNPGTSGTIRLLYNVSGTVMAVNPYGTQPDYAISDQITRSESATTITVSACSGAAPGARLVLAKDTAGTIQAGLIGINIVGNAAPSYVANQGSDESQWIQHQIDANYDFTQLNENYWKAGRLSLQPPGKATLLSPSGTISTATPTYSWNAVPTATWYQLWVNDSAVNSGKVIVWYTAAECGCAAGTGVCSISPSTALAAGAARWWIKTWNTAGDGPWSDTMEFTISGGLPAAAVLLSPAGSISASTPAFAWNAVSGSTWYLLWINDAASSPKVAQWYTAAQAGCISGSGTCSVSSPTILPQGAARWWIQTWNTAGYGPWSDGMTFVVSGHLPGAATLIAPWGTISQRNPTYTWNAVPNATWYYLWVNDSTGTRIATWYTAAEATCASGSGVCFIAPSTTLASGGAQWWIQTWNSAGYGPWSDAMGLTVP